MNLIDPFKGDSIFSLFPKLFGDSKDAAKCKDVESIHRFMTARALQNPDKYKEEARLVKDGVSELLNTKENVNPQEKRPALVRKRAKFSMKPNASDSSTILEPTLQMDQLRDPDEFFAAYERVENAKKEIRRQIGEDPNEAKVSTTTVRQRRPELPRRKTSYKHHVYSSQPESDTSFAQETLQEDIGSQPTFYSQQESVIANGESPEEEVAGSVTETEDRVDELFNHLMSTCNNENLDDKGRLSYLEEFLNAKPPEITELNLPDFHSIPRVNFVSPVKTLPNQSRLSDTRLSLDNSRGKTPAIQIQLSDNRFSPLGSPTPSRSPFFAISTVGKHKSKLSEGKDPFSLHDIDSSHTGTSKTHSGQSTHTRKYKESSVGLSSLVENEVTETAINDVIHTASAEYSGNLSEQCHNLEEKEDGIIGVDYAATAINENGGTQGNTEEVEKAASGTKINLIVEDITDNGHPRSVQETEEIEQPKTSLNKEKTTTRASKADLKKRRQSLAGAGTSWTGGVRKSNRIKRRPLEYWKGERLLYGRVHNSLPTIIGVKYISPAKENGKPECFKDLILHTGLDDLFPSGSAVAAALSPSSSFVFFFPLHASFVGVDGGGVPAFVGHHCELDRTVCG
nr:centromere protein C-like isoform X1 [Tanacetum cinerariifolium]